MQQGCVAGFQKAADTVTPRYTDESALLHEFQDIRHKVRQDSTGGCHWYVSCKVEQRQGREFLYYEVEWDVVVYKQQSAVWSSGESCLSRPGGFRERLGVSSVYGMVCITLCYLAPPTHCLGSHAVLPSLVCATLT